MRVLEGTKYEAQEQLVLFEKGMEAYQFELAEDARAELAEYFESKEWKEGRSHHKKPTSSLVTLSPDTNCPIQERLQIRHSELSDVFLISETGQVEQKRTLKVSPSLRRHCPGSLW